MDRNKVRLHELGATIARERERQGLTQTQLAQMVGNVSHSYLSRVESGQRAPSMKLLFNLADVLDVDVRYFFTRIRKAGRTPHFEV